MSVEIVFQDKKISFHDCPVREFLFDNFSSSIKLKFPIYYDINLKCWVDQVCTLTISDCQKAESSLYKIDEAEILERLENNIGILTEILAIEFVNSKMKMTAERIDGKIITLYFENPVVDIHF